ncbi:long-chain fatty acid--CoA ligase [soil metagenome]
MNLADTLRSSASRLPDKPAMVFHERAVTYGDLDASADAAAAGLRGLGLRGSTADGQPDRVALLLGNVPAFCEALYGIWRAGLVAVPLNATFTADEVAHILGDSGAKAVVVAEGLLGVLDGIRGALPSLEHVVVAGATEPLRGALPWRDLLERGGREPISPAPPAPMTDGLVALLQYTSGTTGRPKGAMLTHANLLANHDQMAGTRLRVEERDVVLCVLPLFHIYALNVAMAYAIARGATLLLVERFDAVATLEAIATNRVSVIIGAPPMYVAWVNTPGLTDTDLASVRFAVSGAAPLPAAVLERFSSEFGIPVWEGYGLTETSPVLTSVAMDDVPRPGSVGKPVPGVRLRLVDEAGRPVRRGDPGEVVASGPNVFSGYWRRPEATAEALVDGWFHTGDIGYASDGDLYLVDRKSDLIIVSGFNVYPREVEEVLYRHPKVAAAAVVGRPHPYTGECVRAVVVLRDGQEATADELIDHCLRSLARFKCPEVVDFVAALPQLPSGKVLRRELKS